jgi:hypothetical protein
VINKNISIINTSYGLILSYHLIANFIVENSKGAVNLNVKYNTINESNSLGSPNADIIHPIPLPIKLKKLATDVRAVLKSGNNVPINTSIGLNKI